MRGAVTKVISVSLTELEVLAVEQLIQRGVVKNRSHAVSLALDSLFAQYGIDQDIRTSSKIARFAKRKRKLKQTEFGA